MHLKREFSYPNASAQRIPNPEGLQHNQVLFSNAFGAYKRLALEQIGWFGERKLMCEDVAAAARLLSAGHRVHYSAEAIALHRHHESLATELARSFDIGASHAFLKDEFNDFPSTGGLGVRFLYSSVLSNWPALGHRQCGERPSSLQAQR